MKFTFKKFTDKNKLPADKEMWDINLKGKKVGFIMPDLSFGFIVWKDLSRKEWGYAMFEKEADTIEETKTKINNRVHAFLINYNLRDVCQPSS